eukprot:6115523-Ditylum_brightwellii.AAC.1
MYKWSEDINIGKKFVLGFGYEKREKKKGDDVCAVYDDYKSKGDVNSRFNYLYTTTLLNAHHPWMNANPANRMCVSFKFFCIGLAHKMEASI